MLILGWRNKIILGLNFDINYATYSEISSEFDYNICEFVKRRGGIDFGPIWEFVPSDATEPPGIEWRESHTNSDLPSASSSLKESDTTSVLSSASCSFKR